MIFSLLTFLRLVAVQHVIKTVPLGQGLPIRTLVPATVIDGLNNLDYNATHGITAHFSHAETSGSMYTNTLDDKDVDWPLANGDIPFELSEDTTLAQADSNLVKRVPAYRGVCKMDCKLSPEACTNACYYQNCIMAGQTVQYVEPHAGSADRVQAGVAVSQGTPCQQWPFGQRFMDPRLQANLTQLRIQTDEWPMYSQQRDDFDPSATRPQSSLRCIGGSDNSRGGNTVKRFREGTGEWGPGGRFVSDRLGSPAKFDEGDWYDIEFYLGDFNLNDPTERAIYDALKYCHPQPDCKNDGFQFHMSNLRLTDLGASGKLGQPYDHEKHNTYRITGEPADIRQFHISLDVTGLTNDQVSARVYVYENGVETELASKTAAPMANGTSFTLPASNTLPQPIRVDRLSTGCLDFAVLYGTPAPGAINWFSFNSRDSGWARWALKERDGRYCTSELIRDPNPQVQMSGMRLKCTFPAW